MKRVWMRVALLTLAGGLVVACGDGNESNEPAPEAEIAAPTAEAEIAAPTAQAEIAAPTAEAEIGNVIVNGVPLSADTIRAFEQQYGLRIEDGEYWYDNVSGAWGLEGGPTLGFILAGLDVGGPLRADASGGGTGVFVNGRDLHPQDVSALEQILGLIPPGRYWLDAYGNYGYEGGPPLGNLVYLVQSAGGGGGGYIESTYGGYIGSDGDTSYFFDPESGCSVMSGGGLSC